MNKRYLSLIVIVTLITILVASSYSIPNVNSMHNGDFKNINKFPIVYTAKQKDSIMNNWSISLGVKCDFCHARKSDTNQVGLDYDSDKKREKGVARSMYRMTAFLNSTYFNPNHSSTPDTINVIVCYSCHRGNHKPDAKIFLSKIDSMERSFQKKH